jgi:crossover junction endodeoxyribonuclease RusA
MVAMNSVESRAHFPIELVLPWPVSCNRYWRTRVVKGVAMTYVSAEAKAYKQQVGWLVKQAGIRSPMSGRVSVAIQLYPKRPQDWERRARRNPTTWDDDVQCLDLDNVNKVLLDSLNGIAIDDDRFVRRIVSERMEPDGEARVVVRICRLT